MRIQVIAARPRAAFLLVAAANVVFMGAFANCTARADDGFRDLFNGKDLSGWRGNTELWSVQDGAITATTVAEKPLEFNTFLIWEGEVGDFIIELDYKIGDKGNSGIQYRSRVIDENKFIVGGYQADIDASMKFAGINYDERGRGILAQRGQRVTLPTTGEKEVEDFGKPEALGKKIKAGEWNHYRIEARGAKVSHYINDQLMSEVIDHDAEKSVAKGVLALQVHTGDPMQIQFKNIKLKTLE